MPGKLDRDQARGLVEPHWRPLYNFVFRLTLDRDRAERYLVDIFAVAAEKLATRPADAAAALAWLIGLANGVLEDRLPRQPEINFDTLDETLRSEATRTDVVRSLSDPQRDFLLWELKQGCMTAVVNCLPPGERAAFVVCHVIKLPDDQAAQSLGITESAYKVRLSRARKKIGDYLAPRCEHVNPMNPCRCPARVGTALAKGFIRSKTTSVGPMGPERREVSLRKPEPYGRYGTGLGNEDVPMRDIAAIYGNLPEPDPPDALVDKLVAAIS
jgi:DNA-directed RNA polymerase specialized sigma24 family protein